MSAPSFGQCLAAGGIAWYVLTALSAALAGDLASAGEWALQGSACLLALALGVALGRQRGRDVAAATIRTLRRTARELSRKHAEAVREREVLRLTVAARRVDVVDSPARVSCSKGRIS